MANISKIKLNDTTYEVEDTQAREDIGDTSKLKTTSKYSLVNAVNECFQNASDGKTAIANAITGAGVSTSASATFATMATNIGTVATNKYNAGVADADARANTSSTNYTTGYNAGVTATKKGTAVVADVLKDKTFTNSSGVNLTGTMANNGAWTGATTGTGNVTIPAGYHNGSGYVSGSGAYNAGVTATKKGTATASQVLTGYTFTNSSSVGASGSMANNGAVSQALNCGGSYTIPAGYHNGSGKVTANDLASQTSADATAADIASGKTAYVNGKSITGTNICLGDNRTAATIYVDSSRVQVQFWFKNIDSTNHTNTVIGLGKVVDKNIMLFLYYASSYDKSLFPIAEKAAISLNNGASWINITNATGTYIDDSSSWAITAHIDIELSSSSPYYSYFASGDKFMCMTSACNFK